MAKTQLPAVVSSGALTKHSDTSLVPALIADAGDQRRLALRRILHRQHSQPEHAPRLRPSMRQLLRLVRRAWPDADDDPAA
jgi:hypothetical protein